MGSLTVGVKSDTGRALVPADTPKISYLSGHLGVLHNCPGNWDGRKMENKDTDSKTS